MILGIVITQTKFSKLVNWDVQGSNQKFNHLNVVFRNRQQKRCLAKFIEGFSKYSCFFQALLLQNYLQLINRTFFYSFEEKVFFKSIVI